METRNDKKIIQQNKSPTGIDTKEYISEELIDEGFRDCRRHKRGTVGYADYSMDFLHNNRKLYVELNNMTYKPGKSTAFLVPKPVLREVICSLFRDRIVHHILKIKFFDLFEQEMVDDAYACRAGKGAEYGIRRLREKVESISDGYTRETFALTGDMRGFFMSINRQLMYHVVEYTIRRRYHGDDIEFWLWLWKIVILTPPEENCVRRGDQKLWDALPAHKSIFKSKGRGLAIGNLPSQMLENLLLSSFDKWVIGRMRSFGLDDHDFGYGRYVDDFYFVCTDKTILLKVYSEARVYLKAHLDLTLHPSKFYLQEVRKGVRFCGAIVKPGRVYARNRTIHHLFEVIREWNTDPSTETKSYVRRINSYFGLLAHRDSYAIRWRAWKAISHKQEIYCVNMKKIRIKKKYKNKFN